MDKEVGNGIILNESQATDKLKASSKKDWKNRVDGKMCDKFDCRIIMKEMQTAEFFRLKNRKNKEVNIRDSKFCLYRVGAVPEEGWQFEDEVERF